MAQTKHRYIEERLGTNNQGESETDPQMALLEKKNGTYK
jgi:hypothetical protein